MPIYSYKTNQTLFDSGFNQKTGGTLTLSGNTILANSSTFQYLNDKSGDYIARSIVDAEYVSGLTSAIRNIGSVGQLIYRGSSGITGATGFIYDVVTSGVTVPNICISQIPVTEVGDYYFLTWDSSTTKVNKMPALSVTGLQGAVNGLGVSGDDACLGGMLINNTCIWGQSGSSISFCINNENSPIVIDNHCNGGIYLKSQCNTSSSYFDDFSNSVGFQINKCNSGFKIYDCRAGAEQKGIEYDGNYSTFYTARSLVDKTYVDTIASGLHPKQAVQAATTPASGNTILSGDTGTIDGISVSSIIGSGNRILVKDQTNGAFNGIYSATTGTWGRTSDFDFAPITGEVVQGSYFFVISGTNKSTTWVLTTPDIITSGDTLIFTEFGQVTDVVAGTGITITVCTTGEHTISVDGLSLAGNSLSWNGSTCQFDVDISGGTLSTALDSKLNVSTFNGYTGTTETQLQDIENDIVYLSGVTDTKLDIVIFSGYTGTTRNELNLTITGATNGLTKLGRQLKLGGTLTGETTINGAQTLNINQTNLNLSGTTINLTGTTINLTGTTINLSGIVTLQLAPTGGTTLDTILVWDSNDKKIKQVSPNILNVCNIITQYTATTANSFIGVSGASCIYLMISPSCGQKVSVADICGGALSNPITINGNGNRINDVSCTCSLINTNFGSTTFIYNGYFWSAVAFTN